eukprot:9458963-Lingulodinium_polyedra.AAC.1
MLGGGGANGLVVRKHGPKGPLRVSTQRRANAMQHEALRRRALRDERVQSRVTVTNVLESRTSPPTVAER